MLLDNFYTILSSESSDSTIWTIQVKLNPGHPVSSCKFLSAINPIETPHISVALTFKETEEGTLQLQAEGTIKKEAVKKSTVKESTVEENTVKNECFIKLKAALTPTV